MRRALILSAIGLPIMGLLVACATTSASHFYIEPVASKTVQVKEQGSQTYAVASNSAFAIAVEATITHGDHVFWVRVLNRSSMPVTVSDSDFVLDMSDDGTSWQDGELYSSEDAYLLAPYDWAAYDVDKLPRTAYGGSPGALGGALDVLQSAAAGASGHPEEAVGNMEFKNRQDALVAFQGIEQTTLAQSLFFSATIAPGDSHTGMLMPKATAAALHAAFLGLTLRVPGMESLSVTFQRIND